MVKVKEKLYEHRFGLFFFVFLMVYNFVVTTDMRPWQIGDVAYSIYAVDFSMGFCTRFLPGAIYNLIFDRVDEKLINAYVIALLILFFIGVTYLLDKLMIKTEEENRKYIAYFVMFFLTGPATFSLNVATMGFFDFYWLLGALAFFLCLGKKQFYIFMIPIFIYMIIVYYGSIVCFLPFFVIILLYKISILEEKKEKYYLTVVSVVAFISMMALLFYMLMFERDNLVYSVDEFNRILESKGVTHFHYYDISFYDVGVDQLLRNIYGETANSAITGVDTTANSFVKTIILPIFLRILIHLRTIDMGPDLKHIILTLPVIFFIFKLYTVWIKKNKKNKLKAFSLFCSIALFFATNIAGLLLSTDVTRWLANSYMPLMAGFFYVLFSEKEFRSEVITAASKISLLWILPYFFIYASTTTNY